MEHSGEGGEKVKENVAGVIRSSSFGLRKNTYCIYMKGTDDPTVTPDLQRLYLLFLIIGHLIALLNRLKVSPPTSLRAVGWRLTGWAQKRKISPGMHVAGGEKVVLS